jgi:hypothetical protein
MIGAIFIKFGRAPAMMSIRYVYILLLEAIHCDRYSIIGHRRVISSQNEN